MFGRRPLFCIAAALVLIPALAATPAAQTAGSTEKRDEHQHKGDGTQQGHEQHEHQTAEPPHQHDGGSPLFPAREGSGTAWLPDATPMYAAHGTAGEWQLMAHGNAFVQYLYDGGDRGSRQFGSINWIMGMARRRAGSGRLGAPAMISLEPWSIRGCGYPDLLATGERCEGETIHDRQHPHDLFMELAAEYEGPLGRTRRWQVYAALAGEPALGPVSYPHRPSAMSNPLAPIVHHWLDATHITFGVVTAGAYGARWKAEASAFNGREPDEHRADLDLGPLDSFSGRFWFLPAKTVALQVSAGRLREAELDAHGDGRIDVDRVTASATFHRPLTGGGIWASTVAWGRNEEEGAATHALLVETTAAAHSGHAWFARFEAGGKSAHDLGVPDTGETYRLAKWEAGYVRYASGWRGLQPGVGGGFSAALVPSSLEPIYGGRVNPGFSLFLTVRPLGRH